MVSGKSLLTLASLLHLNHAFKSYGDAHPSRYEVGESASNGTDRLARYNGTAIDLTTTSPYLTLEYDFELAGFPFFEIESLSGPSQIEIKHSEDYEPLDGWQSDGPYNFANGLANTFRVETLNISSTGRHQSFFIQGGQRWETVRLLSNTSITLSSVGFNLSSAHIAPSDLPGKLHTSSQLYDTIFNLGGAAAETACIDSGNALSTWEITPNGALIRGQAPAQSAMTQSLANYTLSFHTKIARGGAGWRVASGFPDGPIFQLNSNYPTDRTFANVNESLVPANTLVFTFGRDLVNRESGNVQNLTDYHIEMDIREDTWYNISTSITSDGYSVSIDGSQIAIVPITETLAEEISASRFSSGSPFEGAIGFSSWQDQEAYFKDVLVTSENGTVLYQNDMLSEKTLAEYSVADLNASVCLDGGKRDRLVWIGDFYHTVRVVGATTSSWDHIIGTFDYVFEWQKTAPPFADFVPISPPMGSRPEYAETIQTFGGLLDYQDLFLSGIGQYYRLTGDAEWVKSRWANIKKLAEARLAFVDPKTGLIAGSEELSTAVYFLGPANGSAVTALSAYSYDILVPLAEAAGDDAASRQFASTASGLRDAVNEQLWNPSEGFYSLSIDAPSNWSLTAVAWTILSGTANSTQTASMIAKLPELECGVGYKTDSSQVCDETTQLAPNPLGFLLDALLQAHREHGTDLTVAKRLLDDFWSEMVTQPEYFSGASWEYLRPDGSPGLGDFTSLAHPWGGAPSYILPEHILGITPSSPGYQTWDFAPLFQGFGLDHAEGTVRTPFGDIAVSWKLEGDCAVISANVPQGTTGTVIVLDFASRSGRVVERDQRTELPGGKETTLRLNLTSP